MSNLLHLRLLIVAAWCLLLPASAYADPLFLSNVFDDTRTGFSWRFTFTGLPAAGASFPLSPTDIDLPLEWEVKMEITDSNGDGIFALFVDGMHLEGPHQDFESADADPGHRFFLEAQNINALDVEIMSLDFEVVPHVHFPGGDHSDLVELFGRRVGDNFSFTILGLHRAAPVPEPATMLLLGTGLAGVAIKTRKRLKNRKSG